MKTRNLRSLGTLRALVLALGLMVTLVGKAANPQVAIRTNLLWDAIATPNLGLEVGLAPRWTIEAAYGFNNWAWFSNEHKMKHWVTDAEIHYWFCQRFVEHFIGVQVFGGQYNAGRMNLPLYRWDDLRDYRLEGWMVGAGLVYGYHFALSRHWNIEASIGVGYAYFDYDRYPCAECGTMQGTGNYHYFGVTRASLGLIYLFGK